MVQNQPDIQIQDAPPLTTTDVEYLVVSDEELEKPYRIIIQNDDVTPMDFVVVVLRLFFDLDFDRAFQVMMKAHRHGRAHVTTLPYEEAKERVYAAHSAAREASYPLTFYLEPDE
ncbi:MAG: ATP-dependent Clp protease adaptor ClpS [Chloroflexaceae bacterium]|nr:ATP-dependent Clp protease adaptor ClpS [Chloroflexaceae bacterium]